VQLVVDASISESLANHTLELYIVITNIFHCQLKDIGAVQETSVFSTAPGV